MSATVIVASVGVLGLSACSVADDPAPPTEPSATAAIASQLDALEDRMDRVMWSRPSPSSLWHQLDPASDIGGVVLATDAGDATTAPFPFAHDVGDDILTLDVFVSALTRSGGTLSADGAHAYLCATYLVDTHERSFTRSAAECPPDLIPSSSTVVSLDDLELDPVA